MEKKHFLTLSIDDMKTKKKKTNFMTPFFMDGVQLPQG